MTYKMAPGCNGMVVIFIASHFRLNYRAFILGGAWAHHQADMTSTKARHPRKLPARSHLVRLLHRPLHGKFISRHSEFLCQLI